MSSVVAATVLTTMNLGLSWPARAVILCQKLVAGQLLMFG
jgi:hypothetical protein